MSARQGGVPVGTAQFDEIFGYDAANYLNWEQFCSQAIAAADRARLREQDRAAWAGERPAAIEFAFVRGNDDARRVAMREVDVVRDEAGRIVSLLDVIRDVTDLRLAEARSLELNRELELRVAQRTRELIDVNRELEAFAYSVSHDLRTPLRAIDWLAQAVLRDPAITASLDGRERIEAIVGSVTHMSELVEDLLRFSRIGRQRLRRVEIDLNAVIALIIEDLRNANGKAPFRIEVGPLPPLRGDPTLVRTLFQNLLDNAVKFSRTTPGATIRVGSFLAENDPEGPPVYFVRDNGVGFDMRFADKLFGVFQKLHKRQSFGGTGIGLAIVQRVAHRHGGTVWASSTPGQGATFFFRLGESLDSSQSEKPGRDAGAERPMS